MNKPQTIIIGGKAGEGVKKAAQVIATLLMQQGNHVFQQDDYQSLIKGGHNFSSITFAESPVYCCYQKAALLISFDKRSMETHALDTVPNAVHCYNSDDCLAELNGGVAQLIGFPLTTLMKEIYTKPANVSTAAIALCFVWLGWDKNLLESTLAKEFKRDIPENTRYALTVYQLGVQSSLRLSPCLTLDRVKTEAVKPRLISGNRAIALGAWMAGLDFYYAYPMTPASSILHYLALKQKTHRVFAIHAESELAAANMAIGSVFAGARTAVGSSGGGFALMQEAFSMAGIAEAPLLCILSSRPGPATGVSTYTAQEDLPFAINQGHGEFYRIVASPDSQLRAFSLAGELLSLAWEFQIPVILLTDKHLSESSADILLTADVIDAVPQSEALAAKEDNYERYALAENGVSPLLFPGMGIADSTVIKWTSHEHIPSGLRTDRAAAIVAMKDKRKSKNAHIAAATARFKRIAVYGEKGIPVFAYGSTVLELREAQKVCPVPFRIIAIVYLSPLPREELAEYLAEEAIVVEHSSMGNLATYLSQNLPIKIKKSILRYDGRPYDPLELAQILMEAIDA